MEKIDVLMADITVLKNTLAAVLPLVPDTQLLLRRMDAGALAIESALVSNPVTEEYLQTVLRKLAQTRALLE